MSKRVICMLKYYYDEETFPENFFDDTGKLVATNDQIIEYCQGLFVEDVTSIDDPLLPEYVQAWIEGG